MATKFHRTTCPRPCAKLFVNYFGNNKLAAATLVGDLMTVSMYGHGSDAEHQKQIPNKKKNKYKAQTGVRGLAFSD